MFFSNKTVETKIVLEDHFEMLQKEFLYIRANAALILEV